MSDPLSSAGGQAFPGAERQRSALTEAILENAGYAIIATDSNGVITVFNRMAEISLGYQAAELVGCRTPAIFHDPEEVVARAGQFSRELNTEIAPGFEVFVAKARRGLPNEYEWTYVRKDGSTFPVLLSVTMLRNEHGEELGFLGVAADLTERKRAEERLRENEERYRLMFDENPSPMLVYDVNSYEILAANASLLELFGYPGDELLGRPLSVLYPREEHEALFAFVTNISRHANTPLWRQSRMRTRAGQGLVVETRSRWQPFGDRLARLAVFADVTEKVMAENRLEDQGQFMNSLLEALPTPIFYKDQAGRYLGANQAFYDLLGVTAAQYVGKSVEDLSPPELAARYRAADDALFAEPEKIQTYEARVRAGTGEYRDVVFFKAVFRDHHGDVAGLIGAILDITERRRSEQAVRESEARLTQILNNSPLPIFVVDKDHRVVIWNPACEHTFDVSADSMVGTTDPWRVFYPEKRPVMADIILDGGLEDLVDQYYHGVYRRSQLNPEAFEAEGYFPHMAHGRGQWLYFTAAPLRDSAGKVVGAIETLADISERKAAEAETRKLADELERRVIARTEELAVANQELRRAMGQLVQTEKLASLGSLVAGVAHELNTPLGNMLTVATTLYERTQAFAQEMQNGALRRSTLEGFVQSSLEAASLLERGASRASELVGNFKQVAVDQTSVRRRRFDLHTMMEETLSTLRPGLGKTTHRMVVDIPEGIVLDSYPGPLEQIITNFVTNSLLHGFDGRDNGTMTISARLEEDLVILAYADDGVGMTEQAASRAFDPFFTTRLGLGGSGLGLYIVYNMVTAVLGGRISLTSAPGEGVHFVVELPLDAPQEKDLGGVE